MTTEDLTEPVPVPGFLWVLMKWAVGILGSGFVTTVVGLTFWLVALNGRVATIEAERIGLSQSIQEIKADTSATRMTTEELKRDVAVIKAKGS